jgi:4-hydroxy-3-methylbut-2-enyl diphosphate reductase
VVHVEVVIWRRNKDFMEARILVAQPRGFCAGVVRAIKAAKDIVAELGVPAYLPHPVVHNELVIKDLEKQGIYSVSGVESVPDGAVCIFSAHGSPEMDYRLAAEKKLRVVDATCPLVTKVHNEARKYSKEGYDILLIGHKDHRGTMGQVGMTLISEKDSPPTFHRPVAVLTQTTLSKRDVAQSVEKIRDQYPSAIIRDDICYAVSNRQDAVVRLIEDGADLVLVLGSKDSSNSVRMKEVAESLGVTAYLLLDASEFTSSMLENSQSVGISAGASTPESVVDEMLEILQQRLGVEPEIIEVADESGVIFTDAKRLWSEA